MPTRDLKIPSIVLFIRISFLTTRIGGCLFLETRTGLLSLPSKDSIRNGSACLIPSKTHSQKRAHDLSS